MEFIFECEHCGIEQSVVMHTRDWDIELGEGIELNLECEHCGEHNGFVLLFFKEKLIKKLSEILQKKKEQI